MVVVFVGALNVSSISTFARGEIASGTPQHWLEQPPLPVTRGAEIGRFNMGSTVVVLFGAKTRRFAPGVADGLAVRMGQALGAFARTDGVTYERGASLGTLRQRAAMLGAVRAFFAARGVLEVETPALSSAGVTDPAIESIAARARSLGGAPQYLHTSPEFAMKRLLAAGSGDIYQLCRVFRDDELGRWHQPEFTLLEWYRVGWDEQRLMSEVAELIVTALAAATPGAASAARRIVRLSYAQAVDAVLGASPEAPTAELVRRLTKQGIDVPAGLGHDAVLDLAFGTVVLASFDAERRDVRLRLSGEPGRVGAAETDDAARRGPIRGVQRRHRARERLSRARRRREQRRRFVVDLARRARARADTRRRSTSSYCTLCRRYPIAPASRSASIGSWRSRRVRTTWPPRRASLTARTERAATA